MCASGKQYTGVLLSSLVCKPLRVASSSASTTTTLMPAFDVLSTDPWPAANPPSAALLLYNPLVAPLKVTVRTPAGTSLVGCYDVIDSTAKLRGGDGVIAKAVVADAQGRVGVTLTVKADWAALLEFRKCQTE